MAVLLLPCFIFTCFAYDLPVFSASYDGSKSVPLSFDIPAGRCNLRISWNKIGLSSGYSNSDFEFSEDIRYTGSDKVYNFYCTPIHSFEIVDSSADGCLMLTHYFKGSPVSIKSVSLSYTSLYNPPSEKSFLESVTDCLAMVIGLAGAVVSAVVTGALSPLLPILCVAVAISFLMFAIKYILQYFFTCKK